MKYNARQHFALKKLQTHLNNVKKMLSRKRLTIDFETRCELDIKKVGAYKYSEHESCEVLMMSYSLTGKPEDTLLWEKGQRPPMAFLTLLKQPQYALNAFNSYFEYCIWKNVCVRKMGWLDKDITDFHDTQDKCKALALPANLEEAAKVLKVANLKNKEGTALIKLFCQPNPPAKQKKGAPKWNDATTHPDEWKRFGQYCIDDTKATISIENDLPDLSPFEQAVAWMTQQMNWRGVYVDMTAVRAATTLAEELKVKYNKEASILSGGAFEKCTQRAKVKEWFKTKGLPMKDMQGDTVNVTLRRDDLKPECRRMLELYQICGSTSTTKFGTMINYVAEDGRIHELLNYHKARTGRWGGKGIQIQNLPRPVLPWWVDYCEVLDVVKKGSLAKLERYAKEMETEDKRRALEDGKTTWWKANAREILSSCLRAVLCAMFGKHFKCADYSAIEARVLLWLAGDERALDIFRRGEDIYLDMASAIYNVPMSSLTKKSDERPLGKEAVLGCGYGMGHKKFRVRCDEVAGIKISAQMSEDTVKTYRAKYPLVPKLWKKLNAVAMEAVQTPGSVSEYMGIRFTVRRYGRMPILLCRFPSGHVTGYPYPRIATKQTDWGPQDSIYYQGYDSYTNKWAELDTYGGKLTENVTQGVARDLMAFGMLLLSLVDYFMIMTVHDEAVSEDDEDFGDLADFELLLCTLPKWAGTLPVTSEGWEGDRYRK